MLRLVLILLFLAAAAGEACAETYRFSAPPPPGAQDVDSLYGPLLALLSRETGETFRYVQPDNWFAYQSDMRRDRFDLLLDDAHFASWRISARGHAPLAKTRGPVRFVVLVPRAGRIYSREDLIARSLCASPQPDLGTVAVLQGFAGPFQVPRIVASDTPLERVRRLLNGNCDAAVLPRRDYHGSQQIRRLAAPLKIVTQTDAYPGPTLTAAGRVPEAMREAIRRIVLSRAGGRATRMLRQQLAGGAEFVAAQAEEYRGLDELLRNYPGFEQ